MKKQTAKAYKAEIFIACRDIKDATNICCDYCDRVGLCVTVTPTNYVYSGGMEHGVIVGLINYARFPVNNPITEIWSKAEELAELLCEHLYQQSYTIQDSQISRWYSHRPEDNDES